MNRILKTTRYRLAQIASRALVVFAAALAVSGLLTQCAPPQSASRLEATKRGPCKDWADGLNQQRPKLEKLRKAFVTALKQSTTDSGVRERLLKSSDSAKTEILDILKKDPLGPIFDPNFPAEAWFKFFEPDVPITTEHKQVEKRERDWEPEEHCLHIFYLPEVGAQLTGSDEIIFETYQLCCYKPW